MTISGRLIFSALLLAAPVTAAHAATVVHSSTVDRQTTDIHSDYLTLSGFDSTLGTLTGVQIDYGFDLDSEGHFINNGITDATFNFTANYDIIFTFDGPDSIAGTNALNFNSGELSYSGLAVGDRVDFGPFVVSDSATLNPTELSQFIDTDFSYKLDTWTGMRMVGGGGNIYQSMRTYGEGFVQVTYTYDAAPGIPEPATWAFMIAGFGAVGVAMRRRRSGAATTA